MNVLADIKADHRKSRFVVTVVLLTFIFGTLLLLGGWLILEVRRVLDSNLNQSRYQAVVNHELDSANVVLIGQNENLSRQTTRLEQRLFRQNSRMKQDSLENAFLRRQAQANDANIFRFVRAYGQMSNHNQHLLDSINATLQISMNRQQAWSEMLTDTAFAKQITRQSRKELMGFREIKNEHYHLKAWVFPDTMLVDLKVYDRREYKANVIGHKRFLWPDLPASILVTATSRNPVITPAQETKRVGYSATTKPKGHLRKIRKVTKKPRNGRNRSIIQNS